MDLSGVWAGIDTVTAVLALLAAGALMAAVTFVVWVVRWLARFFDDFSPADLIVFGLRSRGAWIATITTWLSGCVR